MTFRGEPLGPGTEARVPGFPAVRIWMTDPQLMIRVRGARHWEPHLMRWGPPGEYVPIGDTGLEASLTHSAPSVNRGVYAWVRARQPSPPQESPAEPPE